MHINKIVLLGFLIFVSNVSIAANPYSECGIGAAMFPNTPWAAATSNATWFIDACAEVNGPSPTVFAEWVTPG